MGRTARYPWHGNSRRRKTMIIALDYDDTYDRDPYLWNQLIELVSPEFGNTNSDG